MFWEKKDEKNSLPDLPPIKNQRFVKPLEEDDEDENEDVEKQSLPAFPDSPTKKGFSQSAIKEAVNPEDNSDKSDFKTVEMEDWKPRMMQMQPLITPPRDSSIIESEKFVPRKQSDKNDVFIRIDKFFSAKKALDTAKMNLSEIDELLKKIRETRMREEQELIAWEKEMLAIKSRIKEVTENIFEKLE
jgi:hypothetical protein